MFPTVDFKILGIKLLFQINFFKVSNELPHNCTFVSAIRLPNNGDEKVNSSFQYVKLQIEMSMKKDVKI